MATDDVVQRVRRELRDTVDLICRSGGGVVFEEFPGALQEPPPAAVVHPSLLAAAEALAELRRQLPLPYSWPHLFRIDPALEPLWDDPQFQALLNDPKNNAPLPIVNRDSPWLGSEHAASGNKPLN